MSDYANKLALLADKKRKLQEDEAKLILKRQQEIGLLAKEFDLLTAPDELIVGLFATAKAAIESSAPSIIEWKAVGGRFRKGQRKNSVEA